MCTPNITPSTTPRAPTPPERRTEPEDRPVAVLERPRRYSVQNAIAKLAVAVLSRSRHTAIAVPSSSVVRMKD